MAASEREQQPGEIRVRIAQDDLIDQQLASADSRVASLVDAGCRSGCAQLNVAPLPLSDEECTVPGPAPRPDSTREPF